MNEEEKKSRFPWVVILFFLSFIAVTVLAIILLMNLILNGSAGDVKNEVEVFSKIQSIKEKKNNIEVIFKIPAEIPVGTDTREYFNPLLDTLNNIECSDPNGKTKKMDEYFNKIEITGDKEKITYIVPKDPQEAIYRIEFKGKHISITFPVPYDKNEVQNHIEIEVN